MLSFPSSDNETCAWQQQHTHARARKNKHTRTWRTTEPGRERESCCVLKDAAPDYMLKLALNVWITHGSSHGGLAAIAKGPGRVHVWMFPSTSKHSFTHAHTSSVLTEISVLCHPNSTCNLSKSHKRWGTCSD